MTEPPMTAIHAATALLPDGWAREVRVTARAGAIASVAAGAPPEPGDARADILVPGLSNLHSHAFQRGMAGLAEVRGAAAQDSFWTWRELMYRHALALDPDQMQAIAAQAYVEMLEAGFTRVGEFHYLHHDRDGAHYADIGELAGRIAAAAQESGIGLTLLPVLYARGGFGGQEPTERQRRFICGRDAFAALLEAAERHAERVPGAIVGVAPHSLRAVTPEELAFAASLRPGRPLHIHIAEQVKEVEDCLAWSGQRPVDWLLDRAEVDARWCLVHATHMTSGETRRVAASGAVAGLCPVTEANLGDGIFDGAAFLDAGGAFGVGTDSNVLIGAVDELRQLEYSQRLAARARNVLAPAGGSTGRRLFDGAAAGGAQALGEGASGLRAGAPADLVALDAQHPALAGRAGDALLDSWIFAANGAVSAVWSGGRPVVREGRHVAREAVARRFRQAMAALAAA
jgi:formimidoylglutamate deiminase